MTRDQGPDVTVVGAGIVGLCCALTALERGYSVEVIDRLPPGEATSKGNAGVISPWSVVPQATPGVWKNVPKWLLDPKGPVKLRWRDLPGILPWVLRFFRNATPERVEEVSAAMALLMHDNVDAYRRLLAGTGREDLLVDAMMVNVYRGAARPAPDELQHRLRTEKGAEVVYVDATELRDLEPALAPQYQAASLVKGQARARDPELLCKALAEKAMRMGGRFRRASVLGLRPEPRGSVTFQTDDGEIVARKLVLAGGIWSAELLRPLGIRVPLIAERGYHLEFPDPGIEIRNSINDTGAKVIASSMEGGVRIAGTAEFAAIDAPPNFERARALKPLAKRLFPGLRTENAREWMGIRPSFPDNLPAIGPIPGIPNVLAAFGHSHYGLGMAPGTARMVVESLSGRPNRDLSAFALSRFVA